MVFFLGPKILKYDCRFLIPHFEKSDCFVTIKRSFAPKKLNIQNTFSYQNEYSNSMEKNELNENKWVSSPLIPIHNKPVQKKLKKQSIPTLKYTGEILFGIHPVYLALQQRKRTFYQLFVRKDFIASNSRNLEQRKEIITMAEEANLPVNLIDSRGFKYLAPGAVHQGVCLDAGALPLLNWKSDISECQESGMLGILLHEILDPMNVGAIIRSAYYFGVTKLFITIENSCKLSATVSKASSGCLEVVNIYKIESVEDFIKAKKNSGWTIISTLSHLKNESSQPIIDISEARILKPTLLILGNEGEGIPSSIQKLCDFFISVFPKQVLHQGIDSLNVSVAAGVILYSLTQFGGANR